MPTSKGKRKLETDQLSGPAMQVTVIAPNEDERSWTLPKTLLCRHSDYFKRLQNFKQGEEGKVTLKDFELETFALFVDYIYFNQHKKDSLYSAGPWETAKAWILGDYLDADQFKESAIQRFVSIYMLNDRKNVETILDPKLIDYCCSNTLPTSLLFAILLFITIFYWRFAKRLIVYNDATTQDWSEIWNKHPMFRDILLRSVINLNDKEDFCSLYPEEIREQIIKMEKKY